MKGMCVCLLVVVFLNEGHVCVFAGGGVPTRRACVCVCVCVCLLLVVFLSEGHISLRSPVWLSVEGVSGTLNICSFRFFSHIGYYKIL